MRKNQRYSQEEMYAAIERCHQDNITYSQYCAEAGIHYATFKYWTNKYNHEHSKPQETKASFIKVQAKPITDLDSFTITYPSGTQLQCPSGTPINYLLALLKAQ